MTLVDLEYWLECLDRNHIVLSEYPVPLAGSLVIVEREKSVVGVFHCLLLCLLVVCYGISVHNRLISHECHLETLHELSALILDELVALDKLHSLQPSFKTLHAAVNGADHILKVGRVSLESSYTLDEVFECSLCRNLDGHCLFSCSEGECENLVLAVGCRLSGDGHERLVGVGAAVLEECGNRTEILPFVAFCAHLSWILVESVPEMAVHDAELRLCCVRSVLTLDRKFRAVRKHPVVLAVILVLDELDKLAVEAVHGLDAGSHYLEVAFCVLDILHGLELEAGDHSVGVNYRTVVGDELLAAGDVAVCLLVTGDESHEGADAVDVRLDPLHLIVKLHKACVCRKLCGLCRCVRVGIVVVCDGHLAVLISCDAEA